MMPLSTAEMLSRSRPSQGVFEGLLPAAIAIAESDEMDSEADLMPEELSLLAEASPKRRGEFAAGRRCARKALARFGFGDSPLLVGPHRAPHWPEGLLGSITHTHDFCAAAVTGLEAFCGLGIDAQLIAAIEERYWPAFLTPAERKALAASAPPKRQMRAAAMFSAKEAFFKCQFRHTGVVPGFRAVETRLARSTFRVWSLIPLAGLPVKPPFQGRYAASDTHVFTAMAWPTTI